MTNSSDPNDHLGEIGETFLGMLVGDVIAAFERIESDSSQAPRRDMIRTLFAAIEGCVWTYREHVRSVATSIEELPPLMELALTEVSYAVTETGEVVSQTRYVSLTAMIRLTTTLAQSLAPDLRVDFGGTGWSNLKQAIAIRNRLTHPKRKTDLDIGPADVETSWAALKWLLQTITEVMAATVKSQSSYLSEFRVLVDDLKNGNPDAVQAYRNALLTDEN
jgi:hypothetical protein